MATDYGVDVKALDDLPDPEELVSGEENAAYAQGRRLLTPDGAHEEYGDSAQLATVDLRAYVGKRMSEDERQELEEDVAVILSQDERVLSQESSVALGAKKLEVSSDAKGREGPFKLVLSVDGVSAQLLTDGG